jgi:2-keto-4-pentenoate hydratase
MLSFFTVEAACPTASAVEAYIKEFKAGTESAGFGPELSLADAACARGKLIEALPAVLGPRVGYKALFTNADSQKRFGVDGPAWGAMYRNMMLASGGHVPARFGAKPRYEPDFIVVVKDAGLADATSPAVALTHIEALVPFMELPDLMLAKPTGAGLIATNAAFRGGVLGPRIPVEPGKENALAEALATMTVVVSETRAGKEIGRAKGDVLMDNPLNAAIWLAQALRRDGVALKPGDLLSLGGFLGSAPVQPGTTMAIRYEGLPGNPTVSMSFD